LATPAVPGFCPLGVLPKAGQFNESGRDCKSHFKLQTARPSKAVDAVKSPGAG
jgi:hypothetical protein